MSLRALSAKQSRFGLVQGKRDCFVVPMDCIGTPRNDRLTYYWDVFYKDTTMVTQTNWLDREWEFRFPAGHFPVILERFRGTPARIEDLVQSFPAQILTVRLNNAWSIQEHLGHLYDLGELDDRRLREFLSGAETLSPADMKNEKTFKSDHNAQPIQIILKKFREERSAIIRKLEAISDAEVARSAMHPRLKKQVRLVDWLYFMAEHDDHHIARMTGIARALQRR